MKLFKVKFSDSRVLISISTILFQVLIISSAFSQQPARYIVYKIPGVDDNYIGVFDINNLSVAVGAFVNASGNTRAYSWTIGASSVTDLGTLVGGTDSNAYGINDAGFIVGNSTNSNGESRPVLWKPGEPVRDLGVLDPAGNSGSAEGIDAAGNIIGYADGQEGSPGSPGGPILPKAFLWLQSSEQMLDLGTTGGGRSFALGLNNNLHVVGQSDASGNGGVQPFVWNSGVMTALDPPDQTFLTNASAINSQNHIVGTTRETSGWHVASLWVNNVKEFLPLLPNDTPRSAAFDINDSGQIVGRAGFSSAVIWENGEIVKLDSLIPADSGWVLEDATAINEKGQIVANGTHLGNFGPCLLTPIIIDVIDPSYNMLSGAAVSSDPEVLGDETGNVPVMGMTTDGVSKVVLRVRELPSVGSVRFELADENGDDNGIGVLSSPGNSEQTTSLTVPVTTVSTGESMAFAILTAPNDFVRPTSWWEGELRTRDVVVSATYIPPASGNEVAGSKNIKLHRPPVLLLHGLNSNAGTWEGLPLKTDSFNRFVVTAYDYSSTHNKNFSVNISKAKKGVDRALRIMRSRKYASTQVDVIGHSMGGIISRMYIAGVNQDYIRDDNYGEGDVNRLITVDTPHQGSPLANALYRLVRWPTPLKVRTKTIAMSNLIGLNPFDGAIDDLRIDSVATTSLGLAIVPCHAIVGVGGSDIIAAGGDSGESLLLNLMADGIVITQIFPNSVQHDNVVSKPSQEGQIPAGSTQTTVFSFDDTVVPTHTATHDDMTQHWKVSQRLVELLNFRVGDANYFASSFPANPNLPPPNIQFPQYGQQVSGITIVSPQPGASVTPGETMDILIQGIDGFLPSQGAANTRVGSDFMTRNDPQPAEVELVDAEINPPLPAFGAPVLQGAIDIPLEAIGDVTVAAFAYDTDWNLAVAEEVTVTVNVTAELTGIRIAPDELFLSNTDSNYRVYVYGNYEDGIERDISSPNFGTTYEVANEEIVTVSVDGAVSVVGSGQTELTARNGEWVSTIPVYADLVTCMGDINVDGVVNVDDLLNLIGAWGTCSECPADINGDGVVNVDDLLALIGNWGPC